jgi:hypothetical protein
MSGFCDRCNERTSHLVNIAQLPELAAIAHLGYRSVCSACYDDLLAEAGEADERGEDRRAEPRVKVSLKARVEGNTTHMDAFSDDLAIEEISKSGLRLHTSRELDPGSILKVTIAGLEATAIVESVWRDSGQNAVGLKLVEPSDGWDKLWLKHAPEG